MERNLYNHVFWFNEYTNLWYAIPRDHYLDFFGGTDQSVALSSKKVETLVELLQKPHLLKKLQTNKI
jgi:hypothetical protein